MENNNFKNFFGIENRTKYFLHAIFALCLASIALFALLLVQDGSLAKKEPAKNVAVDPFQNINLEAKAAIVWDVVNQRELYSKNADLPLPLASLTKVMTALTASSITPNHSNIKIAAEYLAPEGDSQLVVGDSWGSEDLRDFTLLTSSNDGAFALAATAQSSEPEFIKSMNALASKIGLSNSKFFNEHGLDREADRGGAYGSAQDMATLFEYTLKKYPQVLEATRYKNLTFASAEKVYQADNTNTFVDQIPGLLASKTGYTDLAGGNLVIAYDAGLNRPIVVVVLGSSADGRFTDALKLVAASQKEIRNN